MLTVLPKYGIIVLHGKLYLAMIQFTKTPSERTNHGQRLAEPAHLPVGTDCPCN